VGVSPVRVLASACHAAAERRGVCPRTPEYLGARMSMKWKKKTDEDGNFYVTDFFIGQDKDEDQRRSILEIIVSRPDGMKDGPWGFVITTSLGTSIMEREGYVNAIVAKFQAEAHLRELLREAYAQLTQI
jgi:hypothetical protein